MSKENLTSFQLLDMDNRVLLSSNITKKRKQEKIRKVLGDSNSPSQIEFIGSALTLIDVLAKKGINGGDGIGWLSKKQISAIMEVVEEVADDPSLCQSFSPKKMKICFLPINSI